MASGGLELLGLDKLLTLPPSHEILRSHLEVHSRDAQIVKFAGYLDTDNSGQ